MKKILLILSAVCLAFSCAKPAVPEVHVIPAPKQVTLNDGVFKVAGAPVSFDAALDARSQQHIQQFAQNLTSTTGKHSRVGSALQEKGFSFALDASLAPEAYTIDITKKSVKVKAADFHGILYAIQTIGQMLPAEYFGGKAAPEAYWVLPQASIQDQPRFAYRGIHLDVARHFFPVEEVKRYLDVAALHKMNRFHWHLSDDQGWRLEIKKYPRLTEVGAWRDSTVILRKKEYDGKRYGGFYTQDQIRDIVSYAADLGITVIPEIDLPGHMLGALAAYPELGCNGGPYQVWCRWGISDQVLCPGKDATFEFLEGVLTEIMDLFPSEYIHIGGDECPKTEWAKCPDCQRRIKALGLKGDAEHKAEVYLQNYVTDRVQKFLNDHGRKIIGWDEVLEGNLSKGSTVMSWRGVKGGIKAAEMGFDVIMTPNTYMYFDYYQSQQKDKEPYAIGGNLPIEKVYSYEPFEGIPEPNQKHILGVQANLWTEYIVFPEHLEYMLLPRMDALSEVQWVDASQKDFVRFKADLSHMTKIYDAMGYTYCKDVFGEIGLPGFEGINVPEGRQRQ